MEIIGVSMTVSSQTSKAGPYAANGAATAFSYSFRILHESHIRVVRTNADGTESTVDPINYTVTGVGALGGGSVTFSVAPYAGSQITILRDIPFTQETDLENQGAYYAETIEEALDLAAMRDQQMLEKLDRALVLPVASDGGTEDYSILDAVGTLSAIGDEIVAVAGIANEVEIVAANVGNIMDASESAAIINGFSQLYYGPSVEPPAARRNGSPLQEGDMYFDSLGNELNIFAAGVWLPITEDTSAGSMQVTANTFTGDGTTTSFTLSAIPGVAANVIVEVDGDILPTSAYAVSDTSLVFPVAPTSGAKIEARTVFVVANLYIPPARSIDITKFASTITPIELVTELPLAGNFEGRQAYHMTEGKLYRFVEGQWSAMVQAVDIDGTITSTQIADDAITTPKIATNAITSAHIAAGAITASELAANSIIAGKVAAGAIGATEIAAGSITVDKLAAGAITVDGLAANSISASLLQIDARGFTISGVEFSTAGNVLSWTAGTIDYTNDSNVATTVSISAGSAAWSSGKLRIFWTKGATTLSTATTYSGAVGTNNALLAVYEGGANLQIKQGRSIIDGNKIQTGTITADKLNVTSLSSITANIGTLTVGTLNIQGGAVTDQATANAGGSVTAGTGGTILISVTSNHGTGCEAVTLHGQAVNNSASEISGTVSFTGDSQGTLESTPVKIPPKGILYLSHMYKNPTGSTSTFNFKFQTDSGTVGIVNRKIIAIANKK